MTRIEFEEWREHPTTRKILKILHKHCQDQREVYHQTVWANPENAGERDIVSHALTVKAYEQFLDELETGDFCED